MKNVTLSLPDDLLQKSRAYAKKHHTTLNELIRKLLRENVERSTQDILAALYTEMDKVQVKETTRWTREELYEG